MSWTKQEAVAIAVLTVAGFATAVNTTLLSPLLHPIAIDFSVSPPVVGQLGTLTAATAATTALLVGPWMDRFSPRTWLRAEAVLLVVATLLAVTAPTFVWLFPARFLAGVGGAVVMVSCLLAADALFAAPTQRSTAIGIVLSATTVGVVVGLPILVQIEAIAGWRWAIAFLLLPLALLLVGSRWLPGERPTRGLAAGVPLHALIGRYARVVTHGKTAALLAATLLFAMAYFGWLTYFGAYTTTVLGVGASALGLLFLVNGVAELVTNYTTPPLLRAISPQNVFAACVIAFAGALLSTGLAGDLLWAAFAFVTVAGVCVAAVYIVASVLLLDAQPAARGSVMALFSAVLQAGAALGAMVGSLGLVLFGGYVGAYQLLGVTLLPALACLAFARRSATSADGG